VYPNLLAFRARPFEENGGCLTAKHFPSATAITSTDSHLDLAKPLTSDRAASGSMWNSCPFAPHRRRCEHHHDGTFLALPALEPNPDLPGTDVAEDFYRPAFAADGLRRSWLW